MVLEKLLKERVFSVEFTENKTKLTFEEACDEFYSIDLNKKELAQLILELQILHDLMK